MFTACTYPPPVKDEFQISFCDFKGNLRVVVATIWDESGLPKCEEVIEDFPRDELHYK